MKICLSASIAGSLILFVCQMTPAQENIQELYYSGDYNRVIEHTTESIASGDTAINTFFLKALSEAQLGYTGKVIQTLLSALEIKPGEERIRRMLAGAYFEAGDYIKARECFTALVQTDSADLSSWLQLAEIATFRQQYGEAAGNLQQVLRVDSLNLNGLMMMGEILSRNNDNLAVIYYERAYRLYPDNQKAAYAVANWYIQGQRGTQAIPVCNHMLELDSTSIRFQKLLGYALYKTGDPFRAIYHLNYALDLGDSTTFSYKFLGISRYLTTDFQGAIETLQMASRKDSMDAEVHFFLGASMANTKNKTEALFHLNRSLELMQPDPSVVSRIYSEQGNIKRLEMEYEQAYTLYDRAWEADTTNPMALYFMASILDNSLHRSEEALLDYQRFVNQLDLMPASENKNDQMISIRTIVEDRIVALKEELFFLDK